MGKLVGITVGVFVDGWEVGNVAVGVKEGYGVEGDVEGEGVGMLVGKADEGSKLGRVFVG